MTRCSRALSVIFGLLLAIPLVLGGTGSDDAAAIAESWVELVNYGDAAGMVALWEDDGVLVRPHSVYTGHKEIQTQYSELFDLTAGRKLRMVHEPGETWVDGDQASGWGTFEITVNGGRFEKGEYVFRAVRHDGKWRWSRLWTQAFRSGLEAEIDLATLDDYVGTYRSEATGFTLELTRDGDRLFGAPPGADRLAMFPEAKDRFFLRAMDVKLVFERNEAGEVDRMITSGMTLAKIK